MKLTFLCPLVSAVQNSPFLLGHLMPAFVAAPAALVRSSSSAASPKSAQKGQLTRGRRGERAEEEEKEEREREREDRWERDAAPRRQDLSVNEGHCARMETSNGKPKLLPSFRPFLALLQSRRRRRFFSHSLLVFLPESRCHFLTAVQTVLLLATRLANGQCQ